MHPSSPTALEFIRCEIREIAIELRVVICLPLRNWASINFGIVGAREASVQMPHFAGCKHRNVDAKSLITLSEER